VKHLITKLGLIVLLTLMPEL